MSNKAGERLLEKSSHTCEYLHVGLKSEVADNGVAKIKVFVKSSLEEQFTVATLPSESFIKNIEKINFFQQMLSRLSAIAKNAPAVKSSSN